MDQHILGYLIASRIPPGQGRVLDASNMLLTTRLLDYSRLDVPETDCGGLWLVSKSAPPHWLYSKGVPFENWNVLGHVLGPESKKILRTRSSMLQGCFLMFGDHFLRPEARFSRLGGQFWRPRGHFSSPETSLFELRSRFLVRLV